MKTFLTPEPHAMCDVCSEAVTNPLCPVCLAGEIKVWLTQYPVIKARLLPKLNKYLQGVEDRTLDSTQCIKCNDYRASVCPYCFTEYILKELKKLNVREPILVEFFEFFNFDLEHTGYSKEAEMLGVI